MTKQEMAELLTPADAPDNYYRWLMKKTKAELLAMLDEATAPKTVGELMAERS